MKFKSTKTLISLSLLLFSILIASAQEQSQVTAKINLVAWGNEIEGLTLKEPKGTATVAHPFAYNETLSYSGPQLLAIYQLAVKEKETNVVIDADEDDVPPPPEATRPKKEDQVDLSQSANPLVRLLFERKKEEPELVCLVKLPTNAKNLTILLAPASQGVYQPYVIRDDPRKLPSGGLRVHNLSQYPIRVEEIRGRQRCQLAPKEEFLFGANEKKRFVYRLSYNDGKNQWIRATNNSIRLPENQKTQMVVLQSNNEFFVSSDGSRSGFLQVAVLKRIDE